MCNEECWEGAKKSFKEAFGKKMREPKMLTPIDGVEVGVPKNARDGSAFESNLDVGPEESSRAVVNK